jgi:hypothetical protein
LCMLHVDLAPDAPAGRSRRVVVKCARVRVHGWQASGTPSRFAPVSWPLE